MNSNCQQTQAQPDGNYNQRGNPGNMEANEVTAGTGSGDKVKREMRRDAQRSCSITRNIYKKKE